MRILYVTGLVVIFDQITKFLVKGFSIPFLGIYYDGMVYGSSMPIIGDFLRLTYIENPGMAFGIDFGGKMFMTVITIFASIGILIYLYSIRNERFIIKFPLALILGGAIGNLIDRVLYGILYGDAPIFYGRVVDFLDFDFFDVNFLGIAMERWPIFNIADMCVSIGIILVLFLHRTTEVAKTKSTKPATVIETQTEPTQPEQVT